MENLINLAKITWLVKSRTRFDSKNHAMSHSTHTQTCVYRYIDKGGESNRETQRIKAKHNYVHDIVRL